MQTDGTALGRFEQSGRLAFDRSGAKTLIPLIVSLVIGAVFAWLFFNALPQATAPGAQTVQIVAAVAFAAIAVWMLGTVIALALRYTRLKDRLVLTPTGFAVDGRDEIPWSAVEGYEVVRQRGGSDQSSVKVRGSNGGIKRVPIPADLTIGSRDVVPLMQSVQLRVLGR